MPTTRDSPLPHLDRSPDREEYDTIEYGGLPVNVVLSRCAPIVFIRRRCYAENWALQIQDETQCLVDGVHLFWTNYSLAR
jgi:hypothetical protein